MYEPQVTPFLAGSKTQMKWGMQLLDIRQQRDPTSVKFFLTFGSSSNELDP